MTDFLTDTASRRALCAQPIRTLVGAEGVSISIYRNSNDPECFNAVFRDDDAGETIAIRIFADYDTAERWSINLLQQQ